MRFYETSILLTKFTKHKFCQFTKYEAEDKEVYILIHILWTSATCQVFSNSHDLQSWLWAE